MVRSLVHFDREALMNRIALIPCSLLLALAATAAGCGGSDAPSKSEYVKKADAICAKGDKEVEKQGREQFSGGQPSKAEITKFVNEVLVPNISKQIDDLRDLDAPSGDEDKLNKLYDDADAAIQKVKDNPAQAVSDQNDPFKDVNARARAYGLKACGS
jgi:hypothetical protein